MNIDTLSKAVLFENVEMVRKTLKLKAPINETTEFDLAPLHMAVITGNEDVVKELLQNPKLDINQFSNEYAESGNRDLTLTALHWAIAKQNINIIKLLLAFQGINVNTRDSDTEFTAMHLACQIGNMEIVNLLLEKDVNLNIEDSEGNVPLHMACKSGNVEIVTALLSKKTGAGDRVVDIEQENDDGYRPLQIAVKYNRLNVIRLLLEQNVQVNIDNNVESPLHMAINKQFENVVALLLAQPGININQESSLSRRRPLKSAFDSGNMNIFKMLLEDAEIDVNIPIRIGNDAPLHVATESKDVDMINLILANQRANLNIQNGSGNTALHLAVINRYEDIVSLLLADPRTDINIQNTMKDTPLHIALEKVNVNMIKLLLENDKIDVNKLGKNGVSTLLLAKQTKNQDIIDAISSKLDLDVNKLNEEGESVFHTACREGSKELVETFLERPNVDVNLKTNVGNTPLHLAVMYGHESIVTLLASIERVDVNSKNNKEETPLMKAIRSQYDNAANLIKILLNNNRVLADIPDKEGITPLMALVIRGKIPILKELIKLKNPDINQQSNRGNTALMLAAKYRHPKTVEIFLEDPNVIINHVNDDGDNALHLVFDRDIALDMSSLDAMNKMDKIIDTVKLFVNDQRIETLDKKNNNGETPLHLACRKRVTEVVEILLNQPKININAVNNKGLTPFMVVIRLLTKESETDTLTMVKIFVEQIERGHPQFEPDAVDNEGNTLLMMFLKRLIVSYRQINMADWISELYALKILGQLNNLDINPTLQNNAGETIDSLDRLGRLPDMVEESITKMISRYLKKKPVPIK